MNLPDILHDHPDGEIRVRGTRISLCDVVHHLKRGSSPRQIAEFFDALSIDQIGEVADFYRRNQAEVDAYAAADQAEMDRIRASTPPGPSLETMRRRLEARKARVE